MEKDIEIFLKEKFNNRLKVEVKFVDFRNYKILLTINDTTIECIYIYDSKYKFDTNMAVLLQRCCDLIIDYYLK